MQPHASSTDSQSPDFRVAVVGCGKMGLLHASLLNVLPGVRVAAFCEKSRMLRGFLHNLLRDVRVVADVEELADLGLDAVYVTTPIPTHSSVVRSVFSHRVSRNVFVEKTLASTYREAETLCDMASEAGGKNMVGYNRRFAVTFRKAKELLDEGAIGEVRGLEAHAYSSDYYASRERTPSQNGGVLRDLGSHVIDLVLWYFGGVELSGLAKGASVAEGDSVAFTAKIPGGADGTFTASWSMVGYRVPEMRLSLEGEKGLLQVSDDRVLLRPKAEEEGEARVWYRQSLDDRVPFLLGAPEYYREDEHFVKCVRAGTAAPEPSFRSASRVDQVIDSVMMMSSVPETRESPAELPRANR